MLWNRTYPNPNPTGNITYLLGPVSYNDQVFTVWAKETRQWYGYSLTDGSLMWGPTSNEQPYNLYNAIARMDEGGASTAYGILFSGGFGGVLYGYNMTTGKLMWNYVATGIDIESPYGNYPMSIGAIADGKIYVYTDLGYVQQPVWRGAKVRAIDVYSGKEVWSIYSWAIGEVYVASGYAVYADQYNNMINCIGKGPSATTVSTQDFAAPLGTPVMITGTVTDQSPGATGTPAISEQNMEQWMEYLYDQQAKPVNATGVSVHLTAVDPNGNIQEIGTPTSDITGSYAVQWTPPVPGVYKITAAFGGSASYGDSSAQTQLVGKSSSFSRNCNANTVNTNLYSDSNCFAISNSDSNDSSRSRRNSSINYLCNSRSCRNHCHCGCSSCSSTKTQINKAKQTNFFPFLV